MGHHTYKGIQIFMGIIRDRVHICSSISSFRVGEDPETRTLSAKLLTFLLKGAMVVDNGALLNRAIFCRKKATTKQKGDIR